MTVSVPLLRLVTAPAEPRPAPTPSPCESVAELAEWHVTGLSQSTNRSSRSTGGSERARPAPTRSCRLVDVMTASQSAVWAPKNPSQPIRPLQPQPFRRSYPVSARRGATEQHSAGVQSAADGDRNAAAQLWSAADSPSGDRSEKTTAADLRPQTAGPRSTHRSDRSSTPAG